MKFNRTSAWVIAAACLMAGLSATATYGQGACCTVSSCEPAENEGECSGLRGVFLPGESCAEDPCAEGACCFDQSCVQADAYSCITSGREFAGAGTSCIDDPCGAGVGACCNDGACDDASPEECDASGGTWLGAGTNCASGICQIGGCCTPGDCSDVAEFECNEIGGEFSTDVACELGACLVEDDCPLDSLYSQSRMSPDSFPILLSELSEGVQRFDRFSGVAGAIGGLKWFGFEIEVFNDGTWAVCEESTPEFQVTFHDNVAGLPGPAICSATVTVTRTVTELEYLENVFLLEYGADLPDACPMTEGWISIVGLGDIDCSFVWLVADADTDNGDGTSYCDTCESMTEQADLNMCLLGAAGGVFGACCDESTASCNDDVEISDCADVGLRFTADAACVELDPACGQVSGACCLGNGSCSTELELDCLAIGGDWLGGDTTCDQCPTLGACCLDFESCVLLIEDDCTKEGHPWMGPGTSCGDCPEVPECPADSLVDQMPDGPLDNFEAGTSESSTGKQRWENFSGVNGAVQALTWWGLDMFVPEGEKAFQECVESDNTFEITFHEDAGGIPGDEMCSYMLPVARTETGWLYNGAAFNKYEVTLPEPCVVVNGWVSINGLGDPDCWFLWMSSGIGESYCEGCVPTEQTIDLNLCLQGTEGGVFGACCDDLTGTCDDGKVEITDCLAPTQRFLADATCDDFDPPCGTVIGACCTDDTCSAESEVDCDAMDGLWLGANTLCSECPCVTSCPGGSVPEGEVDCTDNFIDTVNGGCDTDPPVFGSITPCEPICATSGVYMQDGIGLVPEFDYYEFEVFDAATLNFTVEAEFPVIAAILDGTIGCPGDLFAIETGMECETVTASAFVGSGLYWLVVTPTSANDLSQCGASYTATLTIDGPCPADLDGDGDVDKFDYAAFQACFTGPNGGPVAPECESVDFDHDDDIDMVDFAAFQRAFTGSF